MWGTSASVWGGVSAPHCFLSLLPSITSSLPSFGFLSCHLSPSAATCRNGLIISSRLSLPPLLARSPAPRPARLSSGQTDCQERPEDVAAQRLLKTGGPGGPTGGLDVLWQ